YAMSSFFHSSFLLPLFFPSFLSSFLLPLFFPYFTLLSFLLPFLTFAFHALVFPSGNAFSSSSSYYYSLYQTSALYHSLIVLSDFLSLSHSLSLSVSLSRFSRLKFPSFSLTLTPAAIVRWKLWESRRCSFHIPHFTSSQPSNSYFVQDPGLVLWHLKDSLS